MILLFFLPAIIFSQEKSELQLDIDILLKDNFFRSTQAAIDIYDLTDNSILYQKNKELLFRPASNMKVVTTSAGLVFLGPEYNFETSVYYTGDIKDSICTGDIYIVGGCDPDFTSKDLDSLVKEIKQFGIKEIAGNLYGDTSMLDSVFWGKGWMWDDELSMDFPYFTPLIINDACIKIEYAPGDIGKEVNINVIPQTDYFKIENSSKTIEKDSSDLRIGRDWVNRSNNIIVSGSLFAESQKDTITTNIFHPEKLFMYLTAKDIIHNGIAFNGNLDFATLPSDSKKIFTLGRKFGDLINNLNKKSDNLSAEMTLRALAYKYFGKPATAANGVMLVDSLITMIGLNPKDYRIVDGSGVSHYNLISAELLTQILKHMYREYPNLYGVLYESFPVGGVDGTLKYRMKDSLTVNNVHAKTGTLSGVSSLSGYLTSKKNHLIAFSILMQNFKGSSRTARNFQDEICRYIIENN